MILQYILHWRQHYVAWSLVLPNRRNFHCQIWDEILLLVLAGECQRCCCCCQADEEEAPLRRLKLFCCCRRSCCSRGRRVVLGLHFFHTTATINTSTILPCCKYHFAHLGGIWIAPPPCMLRLRYACSERKTYPSSIRFNPSIFIP